jgi:hypothetical protein
MRWLALLLLVIASCCKPCPTCAALPPRAVSPPVVAVSASPLPCNLPPLPMPIQLVGMPSEQGLLVTKTDMQGLVVYLVGIRSWIDAAQLCIGAR